MRFAKDFSYIILFPWQEGKFEAKKSGILAPGEQ